MIKLGVPIEQVRQLALVQNLQRLATCFFTLATQSVLNDLRMEYALLLLKSEKAVLTIVADI